MDHYHGKIIIFGEYTVINNGSALAFPLPSVYGSLKTGSHINTESNISIMRYVEFLEKLEIPCNVSLNIKQLKKDVHQGLYLESNAKQGYGIGSSGILTAAIFSKYYQKKELLTLQELRTVLASMESYFHGKSSGIDPLVAFINRPLYFSQNQIAIIDELPENIINKFYLLDTNINRKTQSLVNWYKKNLLIPSFNKAVDDFSRSINPIIGDLLAGFTPTFEKKLKSLSMFQLEWWSPLIPSKFLKMWQEGLKNDQYYLKICGAGGGGYMLIYKKECLPDTEFEVTAIT